MAFSTPGRVVLGLPSPYPRVCTDGQTDGHTLTSQPKFFGSIGYQICLAMELRWQAWPTGSAMKETDEQMYRCSTAVHERKRLSLVVLVNKNQSHHVKFK